MHGTVFQLLVNQKKKEGVINLDFKICTWNTKSWY